MFFLLRMAFWLGLVLVLLPREKTPESDKVPQIGAPKPYRPRPPPSPTWASSASASRTACEVGGQAATAIGQRAQDGARQLYKIITDKKPGPYQLDRQEVPTIPAATPRPWSRTRRPPTR